MNAIGSSNEEGKSPREKSETGDGRPETKNLKVAVLAGDGIGPEVMAEDIKVLNVVCQGIDLEFTECLVGGAAIDATGKALPKETLEVCSASDAILFGSVGGPKWESLPPNEQPERAALLPLRKYFNLFANLRPAICFPELTAASPLRPDIVAGGFDILCIRELTGGLYFGKPKETREENGEKVAIDTMIYRASEIERIARLAFEVASTRKRQLTSVDKMNVLENGLLWRAVVKEVAGSYSGIELNHLLVDNAAMQFIRNPRGFDVVVTENTFGDILSDELAMLTGSIGMLPSASLATGQRGPYRFGLYEPSGGSATHIARQSGTHTLPHILFGAMIVQYSYGVDAIAKKIDNAVHKNIAARYRTSDNASPDCKPVCPPENGSALCENLS